MKTIVLAITALLTTLAHAGELSPKDATALLNKMQASPYGREIYQEYVSDMKALCGGESSSYFAKGGDLFKDGYLMFTNCTAKPDMAFEAYTLSIVIPFMPNCEEPDMSAAEYRIDGLSY